MAEAFMQRIIKTDQKIRIWMKQFGILSLRISLGIIFFWFGMLKFFPDMSPAEDLARQTFEILTFGLIPQDLAIKILATWECAIGLGLLMGKYMRVVLLLLALQMVGAMAPILLFPEKVFMQIPWVPTLEGQYIIKNLVLISAAMVLGSKVEKLPVSDEKSEAESVTSG
ncbi:MAG: DoxX family membrane protein [Desulfuromonadales bacterium]